MRKCTEDIDFKEFKNAIDQRARINLNRKFNNRSILESLARNDYVFKETMFESASKYENVL